MSPHAGVYHASAGAFQIALTALPVSCYRRDILHHRLRGESSYGDQGQEVAQKIRQERFDTKREQEQSEEQAIQQRAVGGVTSRSNQGEEGRHCGEAFCRERIQSGQLEAFEESHTQEHDAHSARVASGSGSCAAGAVRGRRWRRGDQGSRQHRRRARDGLIDARECGNELENARGRAGAPFFVRAFGVRRSLARGGGAAPTSPQRARTLARDRNRP